MSDAPVDDIRVRCLYTVTEKRRSIEPCFGLSRALQPDFQRTAGLRIEPFVNATEAQYGDRLVARAKGRIAVIANFCPFCGTPIHPCAEGYLGNLNAVDIDRIQAEQPRRIPREPRHDDRRPS